MIILGINSSIGPSVCLLMNGEVIFAIEEERLSREKNAMGFPVLALRYIAKHYTELVENCDFVAVANLGFSPITKQQFQSKYTQKMEPRSLTRRARDSFWLLRQNSKRRLGFNQEFKAHQVAMRERIVKACPSLSRLAPEKFRFIRHHDCHAAAAYYGLATDIERKYLILTLDGGGDGECATVQLGKNASLQRVSQTASGNSIGNIYSITTFLMGLTPHEHEYKLMGLAAYVPQQYKDDAAAMFTEFVSLSKQDPLTFTHGKAPRTTNAHQSLDRILRRKRFDNIAGGLQQYTENLVLQWVRNCIAYTGIRHVLLSGGVFMNVAMNKHIAEMPEVDSLAVFPSCGDETNSFGAAFTVHAEQTAELPNFGPFTLGPEPFESIEEIVEAYQDKCDFCAVDDTATATAKLLAQGKIVAHCRGGMEFGARALGSRSIFADPKVPDVVEKINSTIKQRDFWMPFAPGILKEDLNQYVRVPDSLKSRDNPSPYMMVVMDSLEPRRDDMAASLHRFDKTARVEVVDQRFSPQFHDVLTAFKAQTGRSCLLNTSFNVHGHPIVMTAEEALEILLSSTLDAVVFQDYIITAKHRVS